MASRDITCTFHRRRCSVRGRRYADVVPIALVIEPDSMGNLVTNTGDANCGNAATESAYKTGIAYAVTTLKSKCPQCVV